MTAWVGLPQAQLVKCKVITLQHSDKAMSQQQASVSYEPVYINK